jgi:REP element-mobilizing transposase RayT
MPVKQTIPYQFGSFFITFTCYRWLCLIEKVNGYDIIYNWFDILKSNGHFINGFVVMPNHVHAIISFIESPQSINRIIGNGKRFMAYEIIKRLQQMGETAILAQLSRGVEPKRKANKKLHEVWELSFDWKECNSHGFMNQKLDYMHDNPCKGKWDLCMSPVEYAHSSARFYIEGNHASYHVTNFMEMEDVVFVKLDTQ